MHLTDDIDPKHVYRCQKQMSENLCLKGQHWQMISDSSVQIGSYFGSVLQTVDVDGDSYTDLLLVGAPMYMGTERDEQGQVYVYKLNQVQKIEN